MAIDGVKIIDSDDAYDIYNDIVGLYKDGMDVELIKKEWLSEEVNFCTDELRREIYWTAIAYSLWKIGNLDDDTKNKALEIISKGASELWMEIDEKARKALNALPKLKGLQMHSSVMLSEIDVKTLNKLGIGLTTEARYANKKI